MCAVAIAFAAAPARAEEPPPVTEPPAAEQPPAEPEPGAIETPAVSVPAPALASQPVPPRPAERRTRGCHWHSEGRAHLAASAFPCDFPDPMVLRAGGIYYAYGTPTRWGEDEQTFPILASTDLRAWHPAGPALARPPGWAAGDLWAPSVLAARRRYYLYYSALRRRDRVHCLAVATGRNPGGPFRDRGPIACKDRRGRGFIDPAALMVGRRGYLYFSVDGPRHSISVLALTPNLLKVRGPRRVLLGPARSWQPGTATQTVEAPWPVRRGKRYFLFYSAGCWCSDYRMGWAVAKRPTGPFRLSARNPILRSRDGLMAPGGGSVVMGPGGTSMLAFHAWSGEPDYDQGGIRTLRTVPIPWDRIGPLALPAP